MIRITKIVSIIGVVVVVIIVAIRSRVNAYIVSKWIIVVHLRLTKLLQYHRREKLSGLLCIDQIQKVLRLHKLINLNQQKYFVFSLLNHPIHITNSRYQLFQQILIIYHRR